MSGRESGFYVHADTIFETKSWKMLAEKGDVSEVRDLCFINEKICSLHVNKKHGMHIKGYGYNLVSERHGLYVDSRLDKKL